MPEKEYFYKNGTQYYPTSLKLNKEEKENWDIGNIHRFLSLSKNEQKSALNLVEKIIAKDVIVKVRIP